MAYAPVNIAELNSNFQINKSNTSINHNEDSEYWAILFAVGEYKENPSQNRPSMLKAVDDLYNVLIHSDQWDKNNIKKIKGINATFLNFIKEMLWLIKNEDSNDMCLIYLTTHGVPLRLESGELIDIPPFDEEDGADEALLMYDGFENPLAIIWDDLLNYLLGLLESKGVCLIVDSCFSGGFNDVISLTNSPKNYLNKNFEKDFALELMDNNRVILMSSEEDSYSYGSFFSFYLIEGLWWFADFYGNGDGIHSAEEAFNYSQRKLDEIGLQHPTIMDLYNGEFPLTETV